MKKIKLTVLLCLGMMAWLPAQTPTKVELKNVESFEIASTDNKKKYTANIILPSDYNPNDSVRYPVLYVLDGNYSTASFYSISKNYELSKEIKDVLIVCIDNQATSHTEWLSARHYDLTPSTDAAADVALAGYFKIPPDQMKSGGAPLFLSTLKHQIIPFVENRYKANAQRAIFGHSLGGLFVGYCLLQEPALFQKYSMNSPSFWWKNSEMVSTIKQTGSKDGPFEVFISAGQPEGDFMIKPVMAAIEQFKLKYTGIKCTDKIFEDESHISTATVAASKSLKLFYAR